MEYYTLSRYAYLKYYLLILYYRMVEYPPVVRAWAVFTTLCLLMGILIIIRLMFREGRANLDVRHIARNRRRYYQRMRSVALSTQTMEPADIAAVLKLPKNFKMRERQNRLLLPLFQELYFAERPSMNMANWQRLLQAFKMPAWFEAQVRSSNKRKKIQAFKTVADIEANLKEAVASRYLFSKDHKLENHARLHAARFGTSYPFKALEEDPNLVFTDELSVKFHNVLVERHKNGMAMPNFIRWCNRIPVNDELRIFAVNEIRLFKRKEDCAELLNMLKNSHDEAFSCAIIRALGEMKYLPAEEEFCNRYLGASFTERQVLAEAIGALNSGRPETLNFLKEDYLQTTDYVTRMRLLRVIYNYGPSGAKLFQELRESSPAEFSIYFEHIECNLIDSRHYA